MADAHRPVIPGFHPDPSVCRVGEDYYLVCSSFEYAPGVPIFHSRDLSTWRQIGHVLSRPSQLNVEKAGASGGIFAPTLRHHAGQFWMITTNFSDGGGQLLVTAEDPSGPWSDPIRMPGVRGIDPDLAWDEAGRCLMTYAGFSVDGDMGIVQSVIDPETGTVLAGPDLIWNGTGGKFPEGPHLYRIEDWWYLLIAEGGTERGHAVTIARSREPSGPFEGFPGNPILTHRSTDLPVQSTGHADLVERADGSWAVVYHGVRPRGGSPEWHVLGRETFADTVSWVDGWPQLTGHLEVEAGKVGDSSGSEDWVAPSRWPEEVLTPLGAGWQLASSDPDPASDHLSFVGRRQQHLYFTAAAEIDARDGIGGMSLRLDSRHHYDLEVEGTTLRAVSHVGSVRHTVASIELGPGDSSTVLLEVSAVQADDAGLVPGPDTVILSVREPGGTRVLTRLDGRYLSTEVAGGMTGRLIGCYATRGRITIKAFTYTGADAPAVDLTAP